MIYNVEFDKNSIIVAGLLTVLPQGVVDFKDVLSLQNFILFYQICLSRENEIRDTDANI